MALCACVGREGKMGRICNLTLGAKTQISGKSYDELYPSLYMQAEVFSVLMCAVCSVIY